MKADINQAQAHSLTGNTVLSTSLSEGEEQDEFFDSKSHTSLSLDDDFEQDDDDSTTTVDEVLNSIRSDIDLIESSLDYSQPSSPSILRKSQVKSEVEDQQQQPLRSTSRLQHHAYIEDKAVDAHLRSAIVENNGARNVSTYGKLADVKVVGMENNQLAKEVEFSAFLLLNEQNQNRALKNQLSQLQKQYSAQAVELKQYQAEVEDLRSLMTANGSTPVALIKNQKSDIKNNVAMQQLLTAQDREHFELQQRYDNVQTELRMLQEQFQAVSQKLTAAEQQQQVTINDLPTRHDNNENLNKKDAKQSDLKNTLKDCKLQLTNRLKEIEELRKTLQTKDAQHQQLLHAKEKEHIAALATMRLQIDSRKSNDDEFDKKVKELQNSNLQRTELQRQLFTLRQQHKVTDQQLQSMKDKLRQNEMNAENLMSQLDEKEQVVIELRQKIKQLQVQTPDPQQQTEKLNAKLKETMLQLSDHKVRVMDLQMECESMKQLESIWQREINSMKLRLQEQDTMHHNDRKQNDILLKERQLAIAQLKQQLSKTVRQLESLHEDFASLSSKHDQVCDQLHQLSDENAILNGKQNSNVVVRNAIHKIQQLEQSVRLREQSLKRLQLKCTEFSTPTHEMLAELENLMSQVPQLSTVSK